MTYAEQFPDPGPQPPEPDAAAMTDFSEAGKAAYFEASGRQRKLKEWVRAKRKHLVAEALDKMPHLGQAGPAETIAIVTGVAFLEESLTVADTPELHHAIARAVIDDLEDRRDIKWMLRSTRDQHPETYREIEQAIADAVMRVLASAPG